jgi:hypothetical protein
MNKQAEDTYENKLKNYSKYYRNAINWGTKSIFYENNKLKICEVCNTDKNIQIDHKNISFQELLDNFENKCDFNLEKNFIDSNAIISDELKINWKHYHDQNAQYRFLCSKCNKIIGKNGYISNKQRNKNKTIM